MGRTNTAAFKACCYATEQAGDGAAANEMFQRHYEKLNCHEREMVHLKLGPDTVRQLEADRELKLASKRKARAGNAAEAPQPRDAAPTIDASWDAAHIRSLQLTQLLRRLVAGERMAVTTEQLKALLDLGLRGPRFDRLSRDLSNAERARLTVESLSRPRYRSPRELGKLFDVTARVQNVAHQFRR